MLFIIAFALIIGSGAASYHDDDKDLTNKTACITGGARGIGKAIVENLLQSNVALVIIVDINETDGKRTEEELNKIYGPGKVVFMCGDVTQDLNRIYTEIVSKYKILNILVNNAGIVDEYKPKETITVNTIATVEWSLKFYDHMRKDRNGKGGTIINISSTKGYSIDPFVCSYMASKYAVVGFTKCLGHEFNHRATAVRVVTVAPGFTFTKMLEQQVVVDEQVEVFNKFKQTAEWQQPDAVGKAVVEVFRKSKSGIMWDAVGGKPASVSPLSTEVTVDDIDAVLCRP